MTTKELDTKPPLDVFLCPSYGYGRYLTIRENNTFEVTMHKIGRVVLPLFSSLFAVFAAEKVLMSLFPAVSFPVSILLLGSVVIINVLVCECINRIGRREGELHAVNHVKHGMKQEFRSGIFA